MAAAVASALLKVERRANGVAILTFNAPKHLNPLSVEMGNQFQAAVADLAQDDSLRALVLTGEGRAFSAGGDLDFLNDRLRTPAPANSTAMRAFYSKFLGIRSLPVPTIAAINGPAVGAGMALAVACDMRLAAQGATMGFNFVRIGIPPGMGSSYLLARATNPQVASRLLMTGELIKAEEALRLGLLLDVYPAEELLPKAIKLADQIAAASPMAVRSTVVSLRMYNDSGLDIALQREADAQAVAYSVDDLKKGLESIHTRVPPVYPDFRSK